MFAVGEDQKFLLIFSGPLKNFKGAGQLSRVVGAEVTVPIVADTPWRFGLPGRMVDIPPGSKYGDNILGLLLHHQHGNGYLPEDFAYDIHPSIWPIFSRPSTRWFAISTTRQHARLPKRFR